MNRSRTQLDGYQTRNLSLHKPGVIPTSSRNISPVSYRHKYEIKQKIWPKQTVESWFAKHSFDDRRAVYSFLNSLYDEGDDRIHKQKRSSRRKSPTTRLPSRINMAVPNNLLQRRVSKNDGHESRASKRDLGEILESLESLRPTSSAQEKGVQTCATPITIPLPNLNGTQNGRKTPKRSVTSLDKHTETVQPQNSVDNSNDQENNPINRRYLTHTWRVINPREDAETNVRPENNASSFFQYTKKVYPEYFFIHPDWY